MFYELCYELIKSVILLIVLHYLFLYLKNLFIEVYEFNPFEISLDKYIKPNNNENIISVVTPEPPIINNTVSSINYDINDNNINDNNINDNNINDNDINDNDNIKDELLDFINNEYNSDIEHASADMFSEYPSNIN
jgi:hypothetical protein